MNGQTEGAVNIRQDGDIIDVRKTVRTTATQLGFGITDVTRIVTAASELARNIVCYADSGIMEWHVITRNNRVGIELSFIDNGPGIPNIAQVMQEGYTTSGGLGMGLPGSKRLMDELDIKSEIGKGTSVVVRKWRNA